MTSGIPFSADEKDAIKKRIVALIQESRIVTFTSACNIAGVSRAVAYDWRDEDPDWHREIERARRVQLETRKDHAEQMLDSLVDEKNPGMVAFFLKTQAKDRGYVERVEQTGANGVPLDRPQVHVHFGREDEPDGAGDTPTDPDE